MDTINPTQVQQYLSGMDFPASRDDVVRHAKANGADERICDMLAQLPANHFESPTDISSAISGMS